MKFPSTLRKFLAMIVTGKSFCAFSPAVISLSNVSVCLNETLVFVLVDAGTRMKATMHFDSWRAAGKTCRRRRPRGETETRVIY